MSEPEIELPVSPEPSPTAPRSRLRRLLLRHLPLTLAAGAVLLAATTVGLYFYASSARFEGHVRHWLMGKLADATGGRVEIASFHWNLLDLKLDAGGVVIHGLESPGDAPWASVDRLKVRLSVLGLFSPRILLSDLEITHPTFHFIVYPDGSTNQPHPRRHPKQSKSSIDTFFDLKAGHVLLERGVIAYEDRAAEFDYQDRYIPLDLDANDVSLLLGYVAPAGRTPESYHIEAGAADLNLARGKAEPVHGKVLGVVDLTRNGAYLRSLHVTSTEPRSKGKATRDHDLLITGELDDFARPHWQARVTGDLDMRWIQPATGYPSAPEGTARFDLVSAGEAGVFHADGSFHMEDGSYIGTGVIATGVGLDAHVHADPKNLVITSIVARLRQGGQLEGSVALSPWLPNLPGAASIESPDEETPHPSANRDRLPSVHSPPYIIPMVGKVTAQLKDVSLDTILDMVGEAPFLRVGLDSRVNGQAVATWTHGETKTVAVSSLLTLSPGSGTVPGEMPASGSIDATYTHRDGAVDLRRLDLQMPTSRLEARGKLGAYPMASATKLNVTLQTGNLGEFDTVLRDLGLTRNGKSGAAALPITLAGQADFAGTWAGSLLDPRIAGTVKATQLSAEIPAATPAQNAPAAPPQIVRWDTIEASGGYSAERIAIDHGLLRRGKAEVAVSGVLEATPALALPKGGRNMPAPSPTFDSNSPASLHVTASKVSLGDLLPLAGLSLPMTGIVNAQVQLAGPLKALGGSGWVELDDVTAYGEKVARFRAQGAMANQVVKLTSVNVSEASGTIGASGNYDFHTRRFQVDAHGTGIDVTKIQALRRQGLDATGKLGFQVTGAGTLDDPRLEVRAQMNTLALSGEPLGGLEVVAHTANRAVTYDATTRLEGVELTMHGQTGLSGDYATQARLDFSHFNIGSLLKVAHVQGLSGESSLAGTVTVEGPLAKPEKMHGEARLKEMEVTLSGVHLKSEGGVHAMVSDARITLDPLHVTGEGTDLHLKGTLSFLDKQQLDMGANGSVNLKLAQTLDPDLTASGSSTFQVEAHGPLKNPNLQGRVDFQNGSLSLEDIPNGLSQLHGTLEFNQNRLEVKSLTAMSGGGLLSVSGSLAYQHGLYADLWATGKGIRIRYPEGVSSQADATLHLQGSQNNLQLGGNVMITRFTMSQDLDIAALAAQANAVQTVAPLDAPSNHIRLDVHIVSSAQLNFQNAYAKLAGDVDLRLRGTVATPSLLGRVSITEGSAMLAGTRYDLQRGDISFTNPVRIEPSIDLNATARVEDYDITLGLHGTLDKLAVTYRSDPPLPEADVVALLALGRTSNQQRIYTQQQTQAVSNPTTDALLGGALNATVSSRVQKLFGAGSVKVDPNYLGALGNSTSRIIVEEQLSRYVTLTYATNVSTTSQQLIQAEVAINRHVSLLVARDESGVFSMVLKNTRRYR